MQRPRDVALRFHPGGRAHDYPVLVVAGADIRRQAFGIARLHHEPSRPVLNDFRERSDTHRDDGSPTAVP